MPESYEQQVRKLDLRKSDPQYFWYNSKNRRPTPADGHAKPPRGVRLNKAIKTL